MHTMKLKKRKRNSPTDFFRTILGFGVLIGMLFLSLFTSDFFDKDQWKTPISWHTGIFLLCLLVMLALVGLIIFQL